MLKEFISEYGAALIYTVLTAVISYLGLTGKKLMNKAFEDKETKEIAEISVAYAEQAYKDLHGEEKLKKAMAAASALLVKKGIGAGEDELRVYIESAVAKLNAK